MMAFLHIAAEVFFNPVTGMSQAAQIGWKKSLLFLSVFLCMLFWPLARKILPDAAPGRIFLQFIPQLCLQYTALFIYCFIVHGLSGLFFRAGGNIRRLLAASSFSFLPLAILPPLFLLPVFNGSFVLRAAAIGICFLWMACLAIYAVRAAYFLRHWQAALLALFPAAAALSAAAAVVLYLGLLIENFMTV